MAITEATATVAGAGITAGSSLLGGIGNILFQMWAFDQQRKENQSVFRIQRADEKRREQAAQRERERQFGLEQRGVQFNERQADRQWEWMEEKRNYDRIREFSNNLNSQMAADQNFANNLKNSFMASRTGFNRRNAIRRRA